MIFGHTTIGIQLLYSNDSGIVILRTSGKNPEDSVLGAAIRLTLGSFDDC